MSDTLRAAAQQALEALEEATTYTSSPSWSPSMTNECNAAITALRAALAAAVAEPLFLLHCGQIDSSGEQDDWDCEADSGKRVDEFARLHPGQTVKLYAAPPQREPYDQTALGLCNACGWKAVGPDGCLNCAPQREPLTDEQVQAICKKARDDAEAGWPYGPHYVSLVIRGVEQAHGISAPASAPKEQ